MNPFVTDLEITDEQLMEKYKQGNYMAFEALYYRHKDTVYSYLVKRLSDPESRNEVFQNIFLKFHKFKNRYDSKHLFLKWIYTISRSELYDYCKKKKLNAIPLDETKLSDEVNNESELDIEQVKSLTQNEMKAIKLKFYSEQDYQEISETLGTTQVNARKLVSRGLGKIRAKLLGGQNG